ncbi:MAG: hypothetical protein PHO90_00810 [Candidatus Pacebacteria bacterium]|nr:hypothetical protein [Candidatus Paceibacterota bacterium]
MKHSIKTLFIISFCLLFVLTPILAQAQFGLEVINVMSWIQQLSGGNQTTFDFGSALLAFFTPMVASIARGILDISSQLLTWVISPDFMGPGMNLQDNPIIQTGWGTIRNLANVALVFGLVAIAISIIVGYQETKAKKALINFIGVAVLINFTPVICGVIIDFANKLMELFLSSGLDFGSVNTIKEGLTPNSFSFGNPAGAIAYLLFAIFSSVIYFLYAFIFIARHIVLWVLVIVSPIAFASKVFPEGKYIAKIFPSITHWDEWWSQFLQWTVIGIPASFSLYLSSTIMRDMVNTPFVSTPTGQDLSALGTLFSYIVPLAFLVVGFFVTVSSGGQIAEMATGYGRRAFGKITAAGTGFVAGAYTGAKTQAALTKDDNLAKRAAYTLGGGMYGGVKTGVKEAITAKIDEKGKVASTAGLAGMMKYPFGREETKQWVTRRKEDIGLAKPGTAAGMKEKEFEPFKKSMEKLPTDKIREIAALTPVSREDNIKKFQAMQILMEKKDLQASEIDYLTKNIKLADGYGFNKKEFAKFVPERAPGLTGKSTRDVMATLAPKEAREKISVPSLSNLEVLRNLNKKQTNNILEFGIQKQRDALQGWINDPTKYTELQNHIRDLRNERATATIARQGQIDTEIDGIRKVVDSIVDSII